MTKDFRKFSVQLATLLGMIFVMGQAWVAVCRLSGWDPSDWRGWLVFAVLFLVGWALWAIFTRRSRRQIDRLLSPQEQAELYRLASLQGSQSGGFLALLIAPAIVVSFVLLVLFGQPLSVGLLPLVAAGLVALPFLTRRARENRKAWRQVGQLLEERKAALESQSESKEA